MANIKTILLSGTEQEIIIAGQNCDIRNDGAEVIYASAHPGVTAGEDGVLSVPVGGAAKLLDSRGKVFLKGTGVAQICGNDYSELVFKSAAAAGGGTEDAVARNAITALTSEVTANTDDIKELMSSVCNPNLLINAEFKINQVGSNDVELSSDYAYICDRWRGKVTSGAGTVTVGAGVTLCPFSAIVQRIENTAELEGRTLSLSVVVNGELLGGSFVWTGDKSYEAVASGAVQLSYSGTSRYIQIYNNSSESVHVSSVKLEVGSVSTLHSPANITEELAKCQRYYQVHTTGDIDPVDLRPSMAEITDIVQREDGNYGYIAEL